MMVWCSYDHTLQPLSRPFFEQWQTLFQRVPQPALFHRNSENMAFANIVGESRQVYLSYSVLDSENVYFSKNVDKCTDIFDCYQITNSEHCYENVFGDHNYNSHYQAFTQDCIDSWFLYDCINCRNCLLSTNLRNKEYVIRNTQYTPDVYAAELKKINFRDPNVIQACRTELADQMRTRTIHKYANIVKSSRATGDNLRHVTNATYTMGCHSAKDLFGCISVRNRQYCILNRQYPKTEYEKLVNTIRQQMIKHHEGYGEFFPTPLSPFAYNETVAQEYFPLDRTSAVPQGFRWLDTCRDQTTSPAAGVQPCIHWKQCQEQCSGVFKLIPAETKLYTIIGVPSPTLCPNCRHYQRLQLRRPFNLWQRQCMAKGCRNTFMTSYAPNRPERVYCESCYRAAVY